MRRYSNLNEQKKARCSDNWQAVGIIVPLLGRFAEPGPDGDDIILHRTFSFVFMFSDRFIGNNRITQIILAAGTVVYVNVVWLYSMTNAFHQWRMVASIFAATLGMTSLFVGLLLSQIPNMIRSLDV